MAPTTAPSLPSDPPDHGGDGGPPSNKLTGRRRWRQRIVNLLVVLTCVGMLASVIAVWSHRTLLNTAGWMEVVGPLGEDPAVTDAVAAALVDQVNELLQPEEKLKSALPPEAAFLAAPLSTAVHKYVEDGVQQVLASEQFQEFWNNANRRVHAAAVELLRGQPVLGFQATDGVVTLNLLPLITRVLQFIDSKAHGLLGDRTIPDITADTPPDQARQQLADGLGITIRDTFGVVTLFRSDKLLQAQQMVKLFDQAVVLIVLVTVALFVASIALSLHRRRTLIALGLGIALSMILGNAAVDAFQRQVIGLIGGTTQRTAAEVTISNLVETLRLFTDVLIWGGIALVLFSFLSGDSRLALSIRRAAMAGARSGGRSVTARSASASTQTTPGDGDRTTPGAAQAMPVLHDHLGLFRIAGVVVASIWLVRTDVTWGSLAFGVLLLGGYELAVSLLGRGADAVTGVGADSPG